MINTRNEEVKYYLLDETMVDPDLAAEKREILHENISGINDSLYTLTYKQVLQDFGVRNWNGRIYDENIVMPAIDNNPLIQYDLKMGTWTAEYGHPLIEKGVNEIARQMTIFPQNACNTINKYWREGNLLMGECTTLAGGYGDILRDRILTKYPAQASSRALGGVDAKGKVLPGYTVITFDTIIRPSHKVAYQVAGSEVLNQFPIQTGSANTMAESAIYYDYTKDPSFKDFLLSESSSKQQINMLCDTFSLDYDSMVITENAMKIERVDGNNKQTVIIPLRNLVNGEYYNLF